MYWRSAHLTAALLAIALGQPRAGLAQEPSPIAEVKSILREASALIPMIEAHQRSAVAANIASEQTRAGDDAASLTSRNSANAPVGGVAYSLEILIESDRGAGTLAVDREKPWRVSRKSKGRWRAGRSRSGDDQGNSDDRRRRTEWNRDFERNDCVNLTLGYVGERSRNPVERHRDAAEGSIERYGVGRGSAGR